MRDISAKNQRIRDIQGAFDPLKCVTELRNSKKPNKQSMNNGKGSLSTFKYIPANLVTSEQSIKFWTFLALLHNRYWNEGVIGLHQVVLRKIQVN